MKNMGELGTAFKELVNVLQDSSVIIVFVCMLVHSFSRFLQVRVILISNTENVNNLSAYVRPDKSG